MSDLKVTDLILQRTREANKSYSFCNDHNPKIPVDYWFQQPPEGYTLFIVFYSQACRWSKCLGCNLPSAESENHIHFSSIMRQIDFIFDFVLTDQQKKDLRKIIISNNGSILDEATFSSTALLYFIAKMNISCPNIKVLAMESRPEFVDLEELEILSRAIKEGDTPTDLELCIGFEAFSDKIRNDYFNKGLDLKVVEKMAEMMGKYKFKLKAYFMQKPVPQMSDQEAIDDIAAGLTYLSNLSKRFSLDINMHLNPTYVAKGTALQLAFDKGNYTPPYLEDVRKAVLTGEGKNVSIYVGLNDEGMAVPGGSFLRAGEENVIAKLEKFNQTQDYRVLK